MRKLNRAIDLFCYRHPKFGIQQLMLYIVIGNAIVFLFSLFDQSGQLLQILQFNPTYIFRGQIWRIVTFVFVPAYTGFSNIIWEALLLYFYYFIGTILENTWGKGRFTIYYISGAILTLLYGFVMYFVLRVNYSITLNYLNIGLFFAFATLYPNQVFRLFFFIPIKAKWLAVVDAGFFLIQMILTRFPYNLLPLIAIINYLLFFADFLLVLVFPKRRYRAKTVNFNRASRKYRNSNDNNKDKNYTRKCAVCGRTDTEYPNLEFRYCSKCTGYHCFCIEHINNHIHFTE